MTTKRNIKYDELKVFDLNHNCIYKSKMSTIIRIFASVAGGLHLFLLNHSFYGIKDYLNFKIKNKVIQKNYI